MAGKKLSEKVVSGFLKIVTERCNDFFMPGSVRHDCHLFYVAGCHVGYVRSDHLMEIKRHPKVFQVKEKGMIREVHLNNSFDTYESRTEEVSKVLQKLRDQKTVKPLASWRDEFYQVWHNSQQEPLMKIERSAACMFGIVTYGTHVNGFVNHSKHGLSVWVAKRSATKPTYPNLLDQIVAGGLTAGLEVRECARKECHEEASIPDELIDTMKPVGSVSFCSNDPNRGIIPGVEYVYDLELPESFEPKPSDGEVQSFTLMPVEQLMEKIGTNEFKYNCALVNLDFLIRHGVIQPDNAPNYSILSQWLHAPLSWQ